MCRHERFICRSSVAVKGRRDSAACGRGRGWGSICGGGDLLDVCRREQGFLAVDLAHPPISILFFDYLDDIPRREREVVGVLYIN
jgi:hypothetical protein